MANVPTACCIVCVRPESESTSPVIAPVSPSCTKVSGLLTSSGNAWRHISTRHEEQQSNLILTSAISCAHVSMKLATAPDACVQSLGPVLSLFGRSLLPREVLWGASRIIAFVMRLPSA